jgi:hypothetical protein
MDLLILLYIPHVSPSCWFSSSLGWRRHGFAPGRSRVQFWAHAHTNERNHSSTVSLMLISAAPPLPLSASLTGKVRKRWFRTFRFMRKRNWLDLMSGGRLKARPGGWEVLCLVGLLGRFRGLCRFREVRSRRSEDIRASKYLQRNTQSIKIVRK